MAPYSYCTNTGGSTQTSVWYQWNLNTQTTTSTTFTLTPIWNTWVDQTNFQYVQYTAPPLPTAEEVARSEAERAEKEAQRIAARDRALMLFRESLTPEQLETFETDRVVHIHSRRGRRYRVHCRSLSARDAYGLGNIDVLDDQDVVTARLCAHPMSLPDPDMWLAQLLSLEHNENEVIRVANVHYGSRPALVAA